MIPSHRPTVGTAYITTPPLSLITKFPHPSEPEALLPPLFDERTLAHPFNINLTLYNNLLHVSVPTTFAIVYACTVTVLNRLNRQRGHKPWAISRSNFFYAFVVLHNVALAAFSLWACLGMVNGVRRTLPESPGEGKWAEVADALCKMNGPRGLGSAATFNITTGSWGFVDHTMKLLNGAPDPTDVGRLWNEGLAYYGWLFYVSKFYEVVDTFIILSKGKTSSVLQTYHHAGAMMCMWSGIRYMSPPIWMFVAINSAIHVMMYTYYTFCALGVYVPQFLKRILTSLQIMQFFIGGAYAFSHLFVAYTRPVSTPYLFIHNLSTALSTGASSVSSAVASATATAGLGSWLKKAALRAAGEEGLAENVRNAQGDHSGIDAVHAAQIEKAQEEIRWRSEYQVTHCLDTPGQAFALLLNDLYLVPLTFLFVQFFVQSYLTSKKQRVPPETKTQVAKDSAKKAIRNLESEIEEAMNEERYVGEGTTIPPEVRAKVDSAKKQLNDAKAKFEEATKQPREKAGKTAEEAQSKAKDAAEKAQQKVGDIATKVKDELKKDLEYVRKQAKGAKESGQQKGGDIKEEINDKASETKDQASEKASEAKDQASEKASEAKDTAEMKKDDIKSEAKRPSSKSRIPKREPSPVKREPSPQKHDTKPALTNGDEPAEKEDQKSEDKDEGTNGLDESAYEVNPDELKSEEEEKAEREMQPEGL